MQRAPLVYFKLAEVTGRIETLLAESDVDIQHMINTCEGLRPDVLGILINDTQDVSESDMLRKYLLKAFKRFSCRREEAHI